jgi:hypothetical protein
MEQVSPKLVVPYRIQKGANYGTRNFIVAAWRSDPRNHHFASHIPSLMFRENPLAICWQ